MQLRNQDFTLWFMNRGSFLQEGRNWMAWLAELHFLTSCIWFQISIALVLSKTIPFMTLWLWNWATGIFATQYYHLIPTGSPETAVLSYVGPRSFTSFWGSKTVRPSIQRVRRHMAACIKWSCHTKLIKNPGCQSDHLCFTSFNPMSWTAQITL